MLKTFSRKCATMCAAGVLAAAGAPLAAAGFEQKGGQLVLADAGITLPEQAAGLNLAEVREFSSKGKGIDNIAQYRSPDGAVEATVYIYLPTYADAALAAAKTSEAVEKRFGADLTLSAQGVVPAGGIEGAAIRKVYSNASGHATSLALLKVGPWIVKMRSSAPAAREREAIAGLDALLAGIAVADRNKVTPAGLLQLSDCPVKPKKARKVANPLRGASEDPLAAALVASVVASAGRVGAPPASIAANGTRPVCVRERVKANDALLTLVQPAGQGEQPDAVITVLNDAGATIEMRRADDGKNYVLLFHQIGTTSNLGLINRPLSGAQVAALVTGTGGEFPILSETRYGADGKTEQTINVTVGK